MVAKASKHFKDIDSSATVLQSTSGDCPARCAYYYEDGKVLPMTEEKRAEIMAANKAMADRALRVLAAATV